MAVGLAILRSGEAVVRLYFWPTAQAPSPDEVAASIGTTLGSSPQYLLKKRVLAHYTWDRIYSDHLAPLLELL